MFACHLDPCGGAVMHALRAEPTPYLPPISACSVCGDGYGAQMNRLSLTGCITGHSGFAAGPANWPLVLHQPMNDVMGADNSVSGIWRCFTCDPPVPGKPPTAGGESQRRDGCCCRLFTLSLLLWYKIFFLSQSDGHCCLTRRTHQAVHLWEKSFLGDKPKQNALPWS